MFKVQFQKLDFATWIYSLHKSIDQDIDIISQNNISYSQGIPENKQFDKRPI